MENNIKEFLQDVHFIAPDGYSIDYFVLPTTDQEEVDSMVPDHPAFDIRPSTKNTTTVFLKKPLGDVHSDPLATQTIVSIPGRYPRTRAPNEDYRNNKNVITYGGSIEAGDRIFKQISESYRQKTIMLNERVGRFPKNTLFCFTRGR